MRRGITMAALRRPLPLLAVFGVLLTAAPAAGAAVPPADAQRILDRAGVSLGGTAAKLGAGRYPQVTSTAGTWQTTGASAWTSGFFPGSLWLLYERTHDAYWKAEALRFTKGIGSQATHSSGDLGFMFMASYGNAYRLTGKAQYRTTLLKAAQTLAARYEPNVGAIRSWGATSKPQVKVIVDTMMNLDLLFWAASHGGSASLAQVAHQHALTSLRDHVRSDGSVFHLVTYDRASGAVLSRTNQQGASDSSTWSRGQAWGLHGFAIAYAATGDGQLLEGARRTADWYLAHLPADRVPFWDFQAPGIPAAPRDSSAAAIAAAGLLKLATVETDAGNRARYRDAAERIVSALASPAYLASGSGFDAILQQGTLQYRNGTTNRGLSFGDYYVLQALLAA